MCSWQLAILIASNTASGIYYETLETFIVAVLVLGIFSVFLKPLLMLFSLPFIILTFGLGIWLINALMFLFVAVIVKGFHVESFMSALWGAFILGILNLIATISFGDGKKNRVTVSFNGPSKLKKSTIDLNRGTVSRRQTTSLKDDDVIDI